MLLINSIGHPIIQDVAQFRGQLLFIGMQLVFYGMLRLHLLLYR
jgi:hypothetical protein